MAKYCAVLTNTDRELLKHLPGEDENSLRGLIGIWMERNPDRTTDHPSLEEIKSLIASLRSTKPSTTFSTSSSTSYSVRTRENAEWSDITIALAEDFSTAGERLTQRVAGTKYVSHSLSSSNNPQAIADSIYDQIASKGKVKDLKLNIAGNGIYTLNQPQEYYNNLLTEVLSILQSKGVTISAIRSGGQTGIDEAGIIAAQRLNIPNIVHTTSDFKFRGKDNRDISNESAFKNRFNRQSPIVEAPINIYAGTGENAHLSNFAVRPFTITNVGEDPDAPINGTFKTVEGAFQAQKLAYSSISEQEKEAIRKQLETASGAEARRIGKTIKGLDTKSWDRISSSLMYNLILASFQQNPQALQQLLATGNAQLTHIQDRGKWGREFPRILMEVRRELASPEAEQMLDDALIPSSEVTNSNLVITGSSRNTAQKAKEIGGIDTLRHPDSNGMHFGNPFSHANYNGAIKVGSVKEAVIAFEQWLRGDKYQDVEPERRKWIQDQIKDGSLIGKPLVYYTDKVPDSSYGRNTYDYKEAPNHAHILQKYINMYANRMSASYSSPQAPQKDFDTSSFEAERVSSLSEQRAVDLVFDPRVRRDRVTLISRLFSNEVDAALKEKKDEINIRMMSEDLSEKGRESLRQELYSLDRFQIIKELRPGGVFNRVRGIFQEYVDDSDEGRIQAELNKINASEQSLIDEGAIDESERFSDEEKLEAAKKKAAYKFQEYQKILEHFNTLAEEASGLLIMTEGIRVYPNYVAPSDVNLNDDDPEGNSEIDDQADDYTKEETVKDGWMTNFRQVSSHESLSQAIRKIIRETPRLDYEGMIEEDDLGNIRYLDADYVHATLIDKLRYMITSEDMVPLLEDLSKLKPWVEQIIEVINNDDSLFSQFYQDFRKDFVQYWIQKKIMNPDGTFKIETIPVNKPEGVYYLLDSWRDNYESGTFLDKDSVYKKNGEINRKNATIGTKLFEEVNNKFSNATTQEGLELLENEEIWGKLIKMLNMIGIDPNPAILRAALTNIKEVPGITFTDPIKLLLPQLQIIFRGIEKGAVKSETAEDGTIKRGDLINTFGSAYNEIASMLAEVTEDAIESSVRENDKTYYSHVTPSYLGKLVKQLKNVRNNKEKFDQFIQTEFKQYEWFFKGGRWRSDWIEKLATDPAMRKALQHKVVLNYDKIAYQDWDDLDYTIVLLNEYWAEPKEKMAWYHVPILSDSPSAEFIRFVRYTTGSETDEEGNKRTYQDIILDKMVDIINQEYDRIMLVRERDDAYTHGKNISPIANFDIRRDKEGNIVSLGGAEFKFIPELNEFKYENGESFLDRFERLRQSSPSQFRQFLKNTLNSIMEDGFESTYAEWANIGLLDELPNGRFKNIPFQGQSQTNQKVAKSLKEAQKILGDLFTSDMRILLDKYTNNKPINDRQANEIFDQIRDILSDKVTRGELTVPDMNSITRNLTTKNNSKDALREYYWNSKFATSQIIQLTTTDLAFYKDIEDFQKRYKEVHAPSLRLNTMAKFHGETIGRTWERTIYLADDEIVSSTIADIKEVFDAKIAKHEMTEIERDYILSQFRKVNVADAQAYRSLSSYRAMMGMMGQWTDDMETAYKHLTDSNGQWTMEDFNIIWQTKKPYVYTQVNNVSGVQGHTGIKTPVQHKNSEFLLLALYDAIAGPLGKSGKLKAINDFMEKNQIDVVQFESTTKVGKQGVINLNGVKDYDATMRVLGNTTGIAHGMENPNVVHKVSYEDYGIQTATPEHAIDAVQLIGTQIRKLITADIADDAQITIDNKTMTKAEWLKLYNAINTENILQAFKEVDEIFQDPKEVERILQEEIRGNQRYSIDMLRACTLNEDGEFNIPLYDPVQSQRVQTLLNSIIKSRITKQKIRGGALIQVSAYGLTDQLKIVYEGEGDSKRIKYLECYMPAYSRDFYEPLMGENGQLDVRKLPKDLRKLIGYRV